MTNLERTILDLRILVLALGEGHHAGWWRCEFMSPVGLSHLSYIYPRSRFGAAVRAATRAAKSVHDSSIGVGSVYHLFRLPSWLERRLDDLLGQSETSLLDRLGPVLGQRVRLLDELGHICGADAGATQSQAGPRRLGSIQALEKPEMIKHLAAAYRDAFQSGTRVFPYFEGIQEASR